MKPIFRRGPSLQIRLLLAIIAAIAIIITDSRVGSFRVVRDYLDTSVSPFYFLADGPRRLLDSTVDLINSRKSLENENLALRDELRIKNSQLLLLGYYRQENNRLRELLGSPLRQDEHKMLTQVLSQTIDPYSDQIVIDRGSQNGVYEGQAIISEKGIVGQVIGVGKFSSRVLLICDASHALPIQVLRNDVRAIATGNGCSDNLQLEHLTGNTDIKVGDVLVSSGLGGRFPEGYPVAVVRSVKLDTQRATMVIKAQPTADLQHLRYLLLLWDNPASSEASMTAQQVHQIAHDRLTQVMPQIVPSIPDETSSGKAPVDNSSAPITDQVLERRP